MAPVRARLLLLSVLGGLVLGACTIPPYRAHPDLPQKAPAIKTVLLASPKVDVFEIGAGGMTEKIDEWSEHARQHILAAAEQLLANRSSFRIKRLTEDNLTPEAKAALADTYLLFEAVDNAVLVHTYGVPANRFEDKISGFDYSLGQEVAILRRDADAFMFIRGVDHISSKGRIAQQTAATLVAAALGVYIHPRGGVTAVSVAVVDAETGSILWQKFLRSDGLYNLTDQASAMRFMKELLADFPLQ